jgi:hypothetical protein
MFGCDQPHPAGKVMSARERKMLRLFLFGFGCLYALVVGGCVLARLGNCADLTVARQKSVLLAVTLTVFGLWGGLFTSRFLPAILNQWRRLMAGGLPGLLPLAALYVLARLSFDTVSQLLVAVIWAVVPMGIFGGLAYGLEEAAWRKQRRQVSVKQVGQPQSLRNEFSKVERNIMKRCTSSRFLGSSVIAGILLSFIMQATVEFLRRDYNPLRNLLNEYLVGPFSFLEMAAACMLAATVLMLLVGLRLNVRPSGYLTASCALLGVVVVSLCVSAVFPNDARPLDGNRAFFARAGIIHIISAVRIYALLIALLLTLPSAYRRDEKWRPLSHVTLFLGFLIIFVFLVGSVFAPFDLRGLVQRGVGGVILIWLLLTAWRLRQAASSPDGTASL